MMSNDEWTLRVLLYAAIAALCGLALYLVGGFLGNLETHVISPILIFFKDYFANYGKMTAALILAVVFMTGSFFFNFKEKQEMRKKFSEEQAFHEKHISILIQNAKISAENLLQKATETETLKGDQLRKADKIKTLAQRNIDLETEIERLRNPEQVALEEATKVQQTKNDKIKTIVNSIHWGRT